MNKRLLIVLVCAVAIASVASYIVYRLSARPIAAGPAPRSQLVVAARDLEVGALVREGDLKVVDWPGSAPKGSTLKKAGAVNRGVVAAIYQGEPVMESRLAPAGSGGGLAATIPAGLRACAVRVNEVVGVAGFVIPGMRVDVLITGVPPGESTGAGPAVKTLLQNIQVLSAGGNIEKDKEGKPQQVQVVNLLVNPHQAEILSLAGNETRIQLVLRNPMDTEVTAPPGTSMSELFGAPGSRLPIKVPVFFQTTPPLAAKTPAPHVEPVVNPTFETIEVLNGPTRTQAKFQSSGELR
jgi:pilus assembly protein CpaB